jgi:hypothetical protein
MELVTEYLFVRHTSQPPLPFPEYLLPANRHKNDFWITQEGQCIYPYEMDDRHLLNTVRLMHRSNHTLKHQYKECGADGHILHGTAPWFSPVYDSTSKHISREMSYLALWDRARIYMLLRREIKIRGLDDEL